MEPYFADGCPLTQTEKGDRLGKKEHENTKKSRGAGKRAFQRLLGFMQLHQQLNAVISGEGKRRVIVTLLFGSELLFGAVQPSNQNVLG